MTMNWNTSALLPRNGMLNDLLDKKDRIKSLLSDYDSKNILQVIEPLDELVCRTKRNQSFSNLPWKRSGISLAHRTSH